MKSDTLDSRQAGLSEELADLKARYDRLNLLYQVGNVLQSTLDPQEALQLILERNSVSDPSRAAIPHPDGDAV